MTFTELIKTMVDSDLIRLGSGNHLPNLVEITTVRH